MSRLPLIEPGTADKVTEELFATARRQIGGNSDMIRAMANGPAVLNGYLALSAALSGGRLGAAVREEIALAIARGGVTQAQLDAARAAGLDDAEIAEVVGNVALNVLTNYFSKAADVDIDFPLPRVAAS